MMHDVRREEENDTPNTDECQATGIPDFWLNKILTLYPR
jgi:hypothetical protein